MALDLSEIQLDIKDEDEEEAVCDDLNASQVSMVPYQPDMQSDTSVVLLRPDGEDLVAEKEELIKTKVKAPISNLEEAQTFTLSQVEHMILDL